MFGAGFFGKGYFGPGHFGPGVEVGGHPAKEKLKTLEEKQNELIIDNIPARLLIDIEKVPEVTTNRDLAEQNISEIVKEEIKDNINVDDDIMEMIALYEATS
jgi:hypothetical protein